MVYVFLVDAGIMFTFDVSFALKSVSQLSQEIERACNIPVEKQVLIISGGDSLDPNSRVCQYAAGTDSNPFYLFRKIDKDCEPPNYEADILYDDNMKAEVDKALQLPPSYETVEHRAQLARKLCELAFEQTNICQQLVFEQHQQQQGWAASLANMDDFARGVKRNLDFLERAVRNHIPKMDHYRNLLLTFNQVWEKLSQVPVPQALLVGGGAFMEDLITSLRSGAKSGIADEVASPQLSNDESPSSFDRSGAFPADPPENSEVEPMVLSKKSVSSSSLNVDMSVNGEMEASLLQWIHHHDETASVDELVEHCERGLYQFGEDLLNEIQAYRNELNEKLQFPDMKEIKGLEVRLCALEQMMHEVKTLVQAQSELSQCFDQNQNRCNQFGDASILPDLCALHYRQLKLMGDNHNQIQNLRKGCTEAKKELCRSLFFRLQWVVRVESHIAGLAYKLQIKNEGLKRFEARLAVLRAFHAAPQKYLIAVGEVVRRKAFSNAFLKWGQVLSTEVLSIYNEEIARRKEFDANIEDHFVRLMFPGLEDCPLPFATEPPRPFDAELPKLSLSDLEMIRSKLPDVAQVVPAPEIKDNVRPLMSVLAACIEPEEKDKPLKTEDQLQEISESDPKTGVQPLKMRKRVSTSSAPQLKDDRGFESETDTEEFENVGQSPVDLVFQPHAASTASGNTVEVGVQCHGSHDVAVQCNQISFHRHVRSRSAMLACVGSSLEAGVQCRSMDSSFSLCDDIPRASFVETGVQVVKGAPSTPSTDSGIQCDAFRSSPVLNRSCPAVLSTRCEIGVQCGEVYPFGFSSHDHFRVHNKQSSVSLSKEADIEHVQQLVVPGRDDARAKMRELGKAAASLVRLLRSDLVELRQKVDAEGKTIPTMLNEFRTSWEVTRAFINGQSSIQPVAPPTDEKEMTETAQPSDMESRIAELEKLVEEYSKREQELREELLRRDTKDEDFKRVTGELERRLEDVEKYRAHCDELQRRLDDNLESRTWKANQQMESSYQDQVQRLEREKELLAEQAARATTERESLKRELEILQQRLVTAEGQKSTALKEQAAKLYQEHRAEVDNLRSRFKLMARSTMERSPSESSLEGEKVDFTEMCRETMVAQIYEKMAKERDAKIREAIMATRKDMESKLKTELKSMQIKMEAEKQVWFTDTMRRIMSDKERQIASLLDREAKLKAECSMLRWTNASPMSDISVTSVASPDHLAGSNISPKTSKHSPLTVSDIEKFHHNLSPRICALLQQQIRTRSCMPGDVVQVVWDEAHLNFMVVQHKDILYFVHHDSLEALGLPSCKIDPGVKPEPIGCLAIVVDKEYCHARKVLVCDKDDCYAKKVLMENRYHVERGTKFYRVKLEPVKIEPLVSTASQCDPQAFDCAENSDTLTPEPSGSITCSGPSSAISDIEPLPDTPDMPS